MNVSSIAEDPTGAGFYESAFFDGTRFIFSLPPQLSIFYFISPVHPEDDDINGIAEFGGAWSVYPYFESGYILVNTLERGLFVVKYNGSS